MANFNKKDEIGFGLGFYKREKWQQLLETAVDRDVLEDTYDEWLAVFKEGVKNFKSSGLDVKMVVVEISELLDYCKKNKLKNTAETRAGFIAEKLRIEGGDPL